MTRKITRLPDSAWSGREDKPDPESLSRAPPAGGADPGPGTPKEVPSGRERSSPDPSVQMTRGGEQEHLPAPRVAAEILDEDEPLLPAEIEREAKEFVKHAISPNTIKCYRSVIKKYEAWCRDNQRRPYPASVETLRGYMTWLATTPTARTRKPTRPVSIDLAMAAISWVHEQLGHEKWTVDKTPILKLTRKGIRRRLKARKKGKEPFLLEDVVAAARRIEAGSPRGDRDRALLLLGFAAALRRSELTALLVSDLEINAEGLRVWFGRLEARATKGDQEADLLETVLVPRARAYGAECPVAATEAWLSWLGPSAAPPTARLLRPIARSGAILARGLGDDAVAEVVKRAAKSIGKNETLYSGHSLRAGCATSMIVHGVALDQVRTHLRQKSHQTTLGYVRRAMTFEGSGLWKMWESASK